MSKSLGNFSTARDVLKKYSAETVRLLFAQTHYRGPLNFSDELLAASEKGLEKIFNLARKIEDEIKLNRQGKVPDFDFEKFIRAFNDAMDDDFNTPQGIAVIFEFIKDINRTIAENQDTGVQFYTEVKSFLEKTAAGIFGILDFEKLSSSADGRLEGDLIELLIQLRIEAKKEKNYSLADKIRTELNRLGIVLEDSKEKTIFKVIRK
jgi:cysteinyl-tRNA synthetase